uniref:Uncharacterized protein n=1 Tax=Heterosigma akashiwo TaxID=2829 RepID=A0A7S3Y5R8_HETAK
MFSGIPAMPKLSPLINAWTKIMWVDYRARAASTFLFAQGDSIKIDSPMRAVHHDGWMLGANFSSADASSVLPVPVRSRISLGSKVSIIEKHNQRSGMLTTGIVSELLTRSEVHPHGIKVRLDGGKVGRVQQVYSGNEQQCVAKGSTSEKESSPPKGQFSKKSQNPNRSSSVPRRSELSKGSAVYIVRKEDQRSGTLTEGNVYKLLTNKSFHPRGIKVMLENGDIGRVQELVNENIGSSNGGKTRDKQEHGSLLQKRKTNNGNVGKGPQSTLFDNSLF